MGINGLSRLINNKAHNGTSNKDLDLLSGKVIMIDASMQIYQCLIAIRQGPSGQLAASEGEVTSHLTGIFYRTIRLIEAGIKPVYVFDGKPPVLKKKELDKRNERQAQALSELKLTDDATEVEKQEKRSVRATREHSEEVKKMLTLMGIPVIQAPCEAEATCAAYVKTGKAYATATEDMDSLTFGSTYVIRHINSTDQKKQPTVEYSLPNILNDMGITMDQFIEICILSGCDYTKTIKGIGPTRAYQLIQEHSTIENVLGVLKKKHGEEQFSTMVPDDYPIEAVRDLFNNPEVDITQELTWNTINRDALIAFLVEEKKFSADRVNKGCDRILAAKAKGTQHRINHFFKVKQTPVGQKRK
ncbi:flap endonuclease-1 [Emiliania huxleyi virus 201]|nr:flap endonuclease-1 [Emiliania huxleyi virus 203]AEP15846.1 flap structure-specific endonuclease 1 [Emiliania huxleyi virus 207]AET97906.1 flap endonuclease-1 [Emiliania huxleyi virus 201]